MIISFCQLIASKTFLKILARNSGQRSLCGNRARFSPKVTELCKAEYTLYALRNRYMHLSRDHRNKCSCSVSRQQRHYHRELQQQHSCFPQAKWWWHLRLLILSRLWQQTSFRFNETAIYPDNLPCICFCCNILWFITWSGQNNFKWMVTITHYHFHNFKQSFPMSFSW